MECCFNKPAKIVSPRNRNFSLLAQKAKNLVCDNFFCSKCSSVHVECLPGSSRFYLKCLWTRSCQFDTPSGYFCLQSGTLPLIVGKTIQSVFFRKKIVLLQKLLWSHGHFWQFCQLCLTVTPEILLQSPKVWKILFLQEKCPQESSAWHLECLPDETGVFLQIQISSEKPWKYVKLYLLPQKFSWKSFTGHVDFSFDTLVGSIYQRLEFL